MSGAYAISDTYKDVASLVAGLHAHRLDLMGTEAVTIHLGGTLVVKILSSQGIEGIETLVADALNVRRVELRKAILDFVKSRPSLHWVLKGGSNARASSPSICLAARFPRSACCEGRDGVIAELVALVTGRCTNQRGTTLRSAILHGVGGIGKSTVALEVLRHAEVVAHFAGRRFFVGCEALSTLGELVSRLVSQLGVDCSGRDAKAALYEFASSAPALLVLDNFEDLCAKNGPASDLEDFLSSLSEGTNETDGMNLILTKRGAATLRLPRTRSFHLDALNESSAIDAFLRHADRDAAEAGTDPDLPALVARLDGYPLAIMLLAHHFDPSAGITARHLMRAYERRRHEYLRQGSADSRKTSLQVSADLSLASQCMAVPGARALCVLVAMLPDGAEDELIEAFLGHATATPSTDQPDLVAAKRAVVGAGLAAVSQHSLLRMLAPLREHISKVRDVDSFRLRREACSAIGDHTKMLAGFAEHLTEQRTVEESAALRIRIAGQLGNLTAFINDGLASRHRAETQEAIRLSAQLAMFTWSASPVVPIFMNDAIAKARALGLLEEEAGCRKALGQIHLYQHNIDQMRTSLEQALELHSRIDDPSGKAGVLRLLGIISRRQDDFSLALDRLTQGLRIYEEIGDIIGAADTRRSLGMLALRQRDHPAARRHLDRALAVYSDGAYPTSEANTLELLGELASQQHDHVMASSHFERALALYQDAGDKVGEANALHSLGELAMQKDDSHGSTELLDRALALHKEVGNRHGEANALDSLSELATRRNDFSTALTYLREASHLFRVMGMRARTADTLQSLGIINMRMGDFPKARSYFDYVLPDYQNLEDEEGETKTLKLLEDLDARAGFDASQIDRRRRRRPVPQRAPYH